MANTLAPVFPVPKYLLTITVTISPTLHSWRNTRIHSPIREPQSHSSCRSPQPNATSNLLSCVAKPEQASSSFRPPRRCTPKHCIKRISPLIFLLSGNTISQRHYFPLDSAADRSELGLSLSYVFIWSLLSLGSSYYWKGIRSSLANSQSEHTAYILFQKTKLGNFAPGPLTHLINSMIPCSLLQVLIEIVEHQQKLNSLLRLSWEFDWYSRQLQTQSWASNSRDIRSPKNLFLPSSFFWLKMAIQRHIQAPQLIINHANFWRMDAPSVQTATELALLLDIQQFKDSSAIFMRSIWIAHFVSRTYTS